jgi:cytochrome c-type biogenesis protein CcmH/NrfG
MILIDRILLAPIFGTVWIARKIQEAVSAEQEAESEALTDQLSELYMQLETGRISEEEFDAREAELLDRLDALEGQEEPADDEDFDGEDDESFEDDSAENGEDEEGR